MFTLIISEPCFKFLVFVKHRFEIILEMKILSSTSNHISIDSLAGENTGVLTQFYIILVASKSRGQTNRIILQQSSGSEVEY